jgi:hypothetical protein
VQEILDKGSKGKGGGDGEADLNEVLTSEVCVISLPFIQLVC